MLYKKPKFKKGDRVIVCLHLNKHYGDKATIQSVCTYPYGNFNRYVIEYDSGKIDVQHEDDLEPARNKRKMIYEIL